MITAIVIISSVAASNPPLAFDEKALPDVYTGAVTLLGDGIARPDKRLDAGGSEGRPQIDSKLLIGLISAPLRRLKAQCVCASRHHSTLPKGPVILDESYLSPFWGR